MEDKVCLSFNLLDNNYFPLMYTILIWGLNLISSKFSC
jgi:hypothetical protein